MKNAAYQLNMLRGRSNRASPRIEATGIKPIYNREFGLAFGDYAEVRDHSVTKNNITHERSLGCIALHPTGNSQGAWTFWHLLTGKTIISSNWKYLPTPDWAIKQLEDLNNASDDEEISEPAPTDHSKLNQVSDLLDKNPDQTPPSPPPPRGSIPCRSSKRK